MDSSVSHKGSWCWVQKSIFCQENYCHNCYILRKDFREYLNERYGNPSDNNCLSGGDTSIHSIPNEKKQ